MTWTNEIVREVTWTNEMCERERQRITWNYFLSQIYFSTFHGLSLYSMKGSAPTEDDLILIVYHGVKLRFKTPRKNYFEPISLGVKLKKQPTMDQIANNPGYDPL